MIRGGIMWDQADGCSKQYMCSIAYYLMSFISKSYQIFLERVVDTVLLLIFQTDCALPDREIAHKEWCATSYARTDEFRSRAGSRSAKVR